MIPEILQFVTRVKRNHYLVSLYDIFVQIITYHQFLSDIDVVSEKSGVDQLPPNKQIQTMWLDILRYSENEKA